MRYLSVLFLRIAYQVLRLSWAIHKPITVGVRVIMVENEQILLVHHSYQDAWFMPGGAVRRNETLDQAARREAFEETGAVLGELMFIGTFSSFAEGKSDHISLFACQDYVRPGMSQHSHSKDFEIDQIQAFRLEDLPEMLAPGHAKHIFEYFDHSKMGNSLPGGEW